MTFETVDLATLHQIAADAGVEIEHGAHCEHVTIQGAYYCARPAVTA